MSSSLAHTVQFVTMSSSCFLNTGYQTDDLARNRHLTTPWWPSCNLSNISSRMHLGITNLTHFNKSPCWVVSSFWTCQYGFRLPMREGFALISANMVFIGRMCPMTRFPCSETSSSNCNSVSLVKESGKGHLLQLDSCQVDE